MKELKVSFCTTCMNRLHHLRHTLVQNIKDNQHYTNLEFVLLDYNSSDGLSDFISINFKEHIVTGLLKYYRTEEPDGYNMSHSRNMAFRLATGDIVCNIDADNYTGYDFASYVNRCFVNNKDVFLTTHNIPGVKNDVLGRICVKKEHFHAINGYDERMLHYGFDDIDFANRLESIGLRKIQIESSGFLQAIEHSNGERMNNYTQGKGYQMLLIRYLDASSSELILLFEGSSYVRGTIVNNHYHNVLKHEGRQNRNTRYRFSIVEPKWEEGNWKETSSKIFIMQPDNKTTTLTKKNGVRYTSPERGEYYLVQAPHVRETVLFFYNQICNRIIMEENTKDNKDLINGGRYGQGKIRKNFNKEYIQL